jgi:3-isopropylmalate/(R)-2-methylmalate dehydratase large subunit
MAGRTISEKILSNKSRRDARAGDLVICEVDVAMGTDGSVPMALDFFGQMGGTCVFDPERIVFVLDHYARRLRPEAGDLHARIKDFALKHGIAVYAAGAGISHQIMVESGRTGPGRLLVGADSHSVTGGALNAFAAGIGSSDLAATMICGSIWLKVPQSIRVILDGRCAEGVYAKDVALALARAIGSGGASYMALEFQGPAAADMNIEDRLVLSNMAVEMGAKAGIFHADQKTRDYLAPRAAGEFKAVDADPDACYFSQITLNLSELTPLIACPPAVDNVVSIREAAGTPIRMVYLGTCTGGRVSDFHQALAILEAHPRIAPGVQLLVTPASREVEAELRRDGTLDKLTGLGAIMTPPGCGSCCGTAGPVPADGVNVLSTANRNFKARMGNAKAAIYLGSPAACAAAAITGRITDPRLLMGGSR